MSAQQDQKKHHNRLPSQMSEAAARNSIHLQGRESLLCIKTNESHLTPATTAATSQRASKNLKLESRSLFINEEAKVKQSRSSGTNQAAIIYDNDDDDDNDDADDDSLSSINPSQLLLRDRLTCKASSEMVICDHLNGSEGGSRIRKGVRSSRIKTGRRLINDADIKEIASLAPAAMLWRQDSINHRLAKDEASAQLLCSKLIGPGQLKQASLVFLMATFLIIGQTAMALNSDVDKVIVPGQLNDFHILETLGLKHTRTTTPLIDEDYMQEDQTIDEQEEEKIQLPFGSGGGIISSSSGGGGGGGGNVVRAPSSSSDSRSDTSDSSSKSRGLMTQLDSRRLVLPQMQQIKARFNQGCVGGTKCQFFALCWMSGGSLGASCGLLMTCCVTPSRQEIQPGFYGPVVNDPYCGRSTSKINRIVGGTDASFGQFPWQAFVQVGGSRCGGALISSRHVVTAGHCVARSQHSPTSIKVTLGDYILNSDIESIPHEVFSVVGVLLHPNFRFTPQADRYDVAVLELDRTALYKDNIKPICLPQKDAAFVGKTAYVAGWGALQAGSKLRPKVLQHVAVPVIENPVCESWHKMKGIDIRIYDEMMCAGYEIGQRDACQGDSGGPLMLNQYGVWYLVGIVSAGYSCAKQYQPGIYHRVSSSSDWISSKVYQQGAN